MGERELGIRDVALTRELARRGFDKADLAKLRKAGTLDQVRRGVYASPEQNLSETLRHRRLILATMRQLSPEAVVSHTSAAVLHGLPVLDKDLTRVHVTRARTMGQGRTGKGLHIHGAAVDESEIVQLDGLRVTNLARTVIDSARLLPAGSGLAVADAAAVRGVSAQDLATLLEQHGRRRGIRTARLVTELVDARSESAGESISRVVFVEQGIPMPDLQRKIFDEGGREIARVDFCWEQQRTIGEFDGEIKYGRLLKPGQPLEEVLFQEKLREDALRDLGWQVVRWIWRDLYRPTTVADRILRAFERSSRLG
jgi:predicted transcriptional regulator of viral defense system